jgi:hypothetical protein
MQTVGALVLGTGLFPLAKAWQANRGTTLGHALAWGSATWACWLGVAWEAVFRPAGQGGQLGQYLALCLLGCAGVAVLGARRPGVAAWNFVVAGLLVVLLRPLAEGFGTLRLSGAHLGFLAATLAVALVNYLPTRLAPGVLLLGAGCAVEWARLAGLGPDAAAAAWGRILAGAAPWAALASCQRRRGAATELDRLWLAYRDRFGLVWGQRLRDQFNRAAANAGWPVVLTWEGLRPAGEGVPPDPGQALTTLRAILRRFGPPEDEKHPEGRQE